MTVRLIPQKELDAAAAADAAQQAQAKVDGETPVLSTKKNASVKIKVDPNRRPDF
jgi:hypothetical protein